VGCADSCAALGVAESWSSATVEASIFPSYPICNSTRTHWERPFRCSEPPFIVAEREEPATRVTFQSGQSRKVPPTMHCDETTRPDPSRRIPCSCDRVNLN
jgi:hypothetical protein